MSKKSALQSLLTKVKYDPTSPSGLSWLNGDPAGTQLRGGYWMIGHQRFTFTVHLLIWEIHYGPVPTGYQIDHRDTNKGNNLIGNLRLATQSQNSSNTKTYSTNTTGTKGLSYDAKNDRWRGQVTMQGTHHRLTHKDRAVVEQWIIDTRNKLHGAFARHK